MSSENPYANIVLPKGYRNTALQVAENVDLKGKVALVTGGSSGLGVETIRALAKAGAHVINAVRNLEKAAPIVEELKTSTGNSQIENMKVDMADFESVRTFAKEFLARQLSLNIFIMNAGVMALPERTLTKDGNEMMFQVNFLSNMLLSNLLLPALLKAAEAGEDVRVVVVSSCAHLRQDFFRDDPNLEKMEYNKWLAYASSKSAAIQFSNEFNRRWSKKGVFSNACHPGGIFTGLQKDMDKEEMIKMGWIDKDGNPNPMFKTIEQGASTQTWIAVSPEMKGKGGSYYEDCEESKPNPNPKVMMGYNPWIKSEELDKSTWSVGEKILGETFPLPQ